MKTFHTINFTSLILTLLAAIASIAGLSITGFYLGIIVLCLLPLIPIVFRFFSTKMSSRSDSFQTNYYRIGFILNLFAILVMFWMSFVILHDRVIGDCC